MKRTTIAPDTQGIRDYFGQDDLVFFKPGDVQDLARAIQWVHDNPGLAQKRTQRSVQIYHHHLWPKEKERFLGTVTSLLASG
jgi:glycosyltransferase involved in cell wall biosynthesis